MDDVIELSFGGSVREKVRKLLPTPKPNASKPIDAPTAAQLTTCPCHALGGGADDRGVLRDPPMRSRTRFSTSG
jgi:hypothetical protein